MNLRLVLESLLKKSIIPNEEMTAKCWEVMITAALEEA